MTASMDGGTQISTFSEAIDGGAPTPAVFDTAVVDRVAELAMEELRLGSTDLDSTRINRKAAVAADLVARHIGWSEPFPTEWPSTVIDAAITVAVELYRRKDAPFGIAGAWSQDGEVMRVSADPLAGVKAQLAPYRRAWGIA